MLAELYFVTGESNYLNIFRLNVFKITRNIFVNFLTVVDKY